MIDALKPSELPNKERLQKKKANESPPKKANEPKQKPKPKATNPKVASSFVLMKIEVGISPDQ